MPPMSPPSKLPQSAPSIDIIAYTAGLLDGEGSVQINHSNTGSGKAYWSLCVQICNVGEGFLESLREEWGGIGSLTYWTSRGSRKNRRICNWRFHSAQAEWFLKQLLPYLRLKKEHAQIAIEFRGFVAPHKGWFTPERLEKRSQLALRIRELNARTGKGLAARSKGAL